MSTAPINLDALEQPRTILLDGEPVAVKPVTARILSVIRGPGDEVEKLVTVAGLCAPSVSRERLLDLTAKQLSAILAVAQESVEEVKAASPNGEAPTTTEASTAPSSPA